MGTRPGAAPLPFVKFGRGRAGVGGRGAAGRASPKGKTQIYREPDKPFWIFDEIENVTGYLINLQS